MDDAQLQELAIKTEVNARAIEANTKAIAALTSENRMAAQSVYDLAQRVGEFIAATRESCRAHLDQQKEIRDDYWGTSDNTGFKVRMNGRMSELDATQQRNQGVTRGHLTRVYLALCGLYGGAAALLVNLILKHLTDD